MENSSRKKLIYIYSELDGLVDARINLRRILRDFPSLQLNITLCLNQIKKK